MQKYQQPAEQNQPPKPKHGEPPNDELMNGPATSRGCTDILCLLIFIACSAFMVYIIQIGFKNGNPMRLTYPFDPDSRACGQDAAVKNAPYIYLVAPYKNFFNRSTCVSECPNWIDGVTDKPKELSCVLNSKITNCSAKYAIGPEKTDDQKGSGDIRNINFESPSLSKIMNYSVFIYNSTKLYDRICIPDGKEFIDLLDITGSIDMSVSQEWVSDVVTTWPIILASAGIAILIGLIYMILMRYCSGVLTWLGILLYFACVVLLIIFTNSEQSAYEGQAQYNKAQGIPDSENSDINNAKALKYLSYALIIVLILSILAFFCYFTRIRLAIAIIKSASLYILHVPFSLLVPPLFAIITLLFWCLWIYSFVYVYSVGNIKGSPTSPFATVTWDEDTRRMLYFHFFMALWDNALIQAICSFILASSCCIWYFSQGPGQPLLQFPLCVSTKRALINHIGSLMVGSFILAVVQFIRCWLEYINYQISMIKGEKPQPLKCFIDCCRCYSDCFERFISFLNKNAYIQIALTGKSFIPAAKDGFYLIYTNPGKFAIVCGIGNIFTMIGKLFIAAFTTYVCYMIITRSDRYKDRIFSPFLPCFFFFIVSYVIGELFMLVYGMSIDTILQCSIVDEELSKKKGHPPKFCPQPLKDFYGSLEK